MYPRFEFNGVNIPWLYGIIIVTAGEGCTTHMLIQLHLILRNRLLAPPHLLRKCCVFFHSVSKVEGNIHRDTIQCVQLFNLALVSSPLRGLQVVPPMRHAYRVCSYVREIRIVMQFGEETCRLLKRTKCGKTKPAQSQCKITILGQFFIVGRIPVHIALELSVRQLDELTCSNSSFPAKLNRRPKKRAIVLL